MRLTKVNATKHGAVAEGCVIAREFLRRSRTSRELAGQRPTCFASALNDAVEPRCLIDTTDATACYPTDLQQELCFIDNFGLQILPGTCLLRKSPLNMRRVFAEAGDSWVELSRLSSEFLQVLKSWSTFTCAVWCSLHSCAETQKSLSCAATNALCLIV